MLGARLVKPHERLPGGSAYEAVLRVAAGGMGTVFVARRKNAKVARLYAVKRTHKHLIGEPGFSEAIAREGELASRIHHPNVVAVHDVEEVDDEVLLVMDWVDGVDADTFIERPDGPGTYTPAVVRVLLDAAAGLHAAHELVDEHGRKLEVVHRDISPHNVLVGADGQAKVTDFGVAKARADIAPQTATGLLAGKMAYVAPEYANEGICDARSDVFALGVVAWELLCARRMVGESPDSDDDEIALDRVRKIERPSAIHPSLAWADEVVMKALAVEPGARHQTAGAFGTALLAAAARGSALGTPEHVIVMVDRLVGPKLAERAAAVRDGIRLLDGQAPRVVSPGVGEQTQSIVDSVPTLDSNALESVTLPTEPVPASTEEVTTSVYAPDALERAAEENPRVRSLLKSDPNYRKPWDTHSAAAAATAPPPVADLRSVPPHRVGGSRATWLLAGVLAIGVGAATTYYRQTHREDPPAPGEGIVPATPAPSRELAPPPPVMLPAIAPAVTMPAAVADAQAAATEDTDDEPRAGRRPVGRPRPPRVRSPNRAPSTPASSTPMPPAPATPAGDPVIVPAPAPAGSRILPNPYPSRP